ncbi:MAG: YadA-like family protein [Betaproteobacteria bacterium]|nr:YadA-like family protein [Betaproteobacteria bacterium]
MNGSQLYATNQDEDCAGGAQHHGCSHRHWVANGAQLVAIVPKSTLTYTAGDNMVLTQKGAELQFAVNANPNFDSLTAQNITANGTTTLGGAVNGPQHHREYGQQPDHQRGAWHCQCGCVNMGQLQAVNTALTQNINQVAKIAYAGVAAAIAMESAPYVAGKLTYAAGVGHFEGQSALGVSLRRTAESGRWSISGGISSSPIRGTAVRAGISGVFD